MAVVNEYKMYGVTSTSAEGPIKFFGLGSDGNKSGGNTPTITITNNGFQVINTQTLATAASVEILTNPMVVEGNTVLSYTTAGTVSDGVDITISYLNIRKEVTK